MWKIFTNFTRLEKFLVFFLTGVIVFISLQLTWFFYRENTEVQFAQGGTYAEGLVGEIKLINPVFANQNPIDEDIVSLVFAGLMKYDAQQETIVDDLADHTLSQDQKTYTFTIKENAYFHDGEKVTADDVVFTFQSIIQNSEFENELLRREFEGIEIKKIDNQTVTFTLPKPYKFFLTNLTIGILPKHLLFDLPVANLDQSSFNQNPVGAGPFRFSQILANTNSIDVVLKKFENYYGDEPILDGIVLKIYRNYQTLLQNLDVLNGVRAILKDKIESFPTQNRFEVVSYHLPQYVALFLNNNSEILKNEKVRLALQLATDRQKIAKNLGENMIIDDPLMEINQQNWIYQFDTQKATGGLYDAGWNLPKKEENETEIIKTNSGGSVTGEISFSSFFTISKANAEEINYITAPNGGENYETTETSFYIRGNAPANINEIWVNNYALKLYKPGNPTWSYKANTEIETLKKGENLYEIFAVDQSGRKSKIDEMKITLVEKSIETSQLLEEDLVQFDSVENKEEDSELTDSSQVEIDEQEKTSVSSLRTENKIQSGVVLEEEVRKTSQKEKEDLNIRKNKEKKSLILRLVTSSRPIFYQKIAEEIKMQWLEVGVDVKIEVYEMDEFQEKVTERDYDILLYGQSLGYNLDTYPYWHSSQMEEKGLNLANYASFESDSLMEEIRMTHNVERRNIALEKLKTSMSKDVPAIFLYRPVYYLAYDKKLKNIEIENLPTMSDRFANVESWYMKEERFFTEGKSWKDIFSWIKETAWKIN